MSQNNVGRFPADYEELSNYLLRTPVGKKHGRASESEGIGGWVVINPFLYGSTAYLAVTDRGVSGESASGEGFLIGKYKSPEELEEVCYFKQKPAGKQKVHK